MWKSCGWRVVKDLVHHGGRRPRSQNPCGVLGLRRFGNEEQCGILDSGWNFQRRAGFAAAGVGGYGEGEKTSKSVGGGGLPISFGEAKRLMRLVNVEALKTKLGTEGKEAIPYNDLLEACQSIGVARSKEEAAAFARVLDEAGVILLFRDKVLLHPDRHQEVSPTLTLKAARNLAYEFLHAAGPLCRKRFINRNMQWLPPPSGLFKINTDASWYPPNQAGIGAVIRDSNRVLIAGTEAEASAILAGADLAASLQLQDVIIESDSEEVILEL